MRLLILLCIGVVAFSSCKEEKKKDWTGHEDHIEIHQQDVISDGVTLPVLGFPKEVDGKTVPYSVGDFEFIDQDSSIVTAETFEGKIYAVDFFFTRCPSICPIMTKSMVRLYDKYEGDERVAFLSHSIDSRNDSISVLKQYAEDLGVASNQWKFVTGERQEIKRMAKQYMASVVEDENMPGGYDHSGQFVLVDTKGQIRSVCDGTDGNSVTRFMGDIEKLLNEEFTDK